jgi:septal ring-binding cell division protein DamX
LKPQSKPAESVEQAVVIQTNDVADELASIAGGSSATTDTTAPLATAPAAEVTAEHTQQYSYQETKLLALPADQVALQLVVFSNDAALNNFKQSYAGLPALVYQRQKNGQRQLVVVLAPFADGQAAKANLSSLPAALQSGFVKSIADIQSEIKQQ